MSDKKNTITMNGQPLTLKGHTLGEGDKAPDFEVTDNDMKPKTLSDFSEKVLIISSVPSLDTPVCDIETRRFNKEAVDLGTDIGFLTISMDLPFAQRRWCGAAGIERVVTLSDYKNASFGNAYGVMIEEIGLLARAVFILDQKRTVRHIEIVQDISKEPDYEHVIETAKNILAE